METKSYLSLSANYWQLWQKIEYPLFITTVIFLPLAIPVPQVITGSIVNFIIVRTSLKYSKWRSIPVIMLPSLAAIAGSLLFGEATQYLIFMVPVIWVGNFIMAHFASHSYGAAIKASFLKVAIIFGFVALMYALGKVPVLFLVAMGPLQLVTAFIGGIVAVAMSKK